MKPNVKKIWIDDRNDDEIAIRIDWNNDRHHTVTIMPPYSKNEVVFALLTMANLVNKDTNLD